MLHSHFPPPVARAMFRIREHSFFVCVFAELVVWYFLWTYFRRTFSWFFFPSCLQTYFPTGFLDRFLDRHIFPQSPAHIFPRGSGRFHSSPPIDPFTGALPPQPPADGQALQALPAAARCPPLVPQRVRVSLPHPPPRPTDQSLCFSEKWSCYNYSRIKSYSTKSHVVPSPEPLNPCH